MRSISDGASNIFLTHNFVAQSISDAMQALADKPLAKIALDGPALEYLFGDAKNQTTDHLNFLIDRVLIFSRTTPKQKEDIIEFIKQYLGLQTHVFCVAYVGDGQNDSRALRVANVGLSIGSNESSIASGFNTKIESIGPVIDLLIEGRANLSLTI